MIKENDDFGFTFVDQEEFEAYEKQLQDQIATHSVQTRSLSNQVTVLQDKINMVMGIINPFLKNLGSDPNKVYIKWANRGEKIKQLQDKLNAIIKE